MTASDVVELVSAATLWVVLTAYHADIWQLPRVGPWLFTAALLTAAAVLTAQAGRDGPAYDVLPRLLLCAAQVAALVTVWLAYHHAPRQTRDGSS